MKQPPLHCSDARFSLRFVETRVDEPWLCLFTINKFRALLKRDGTPAETRFRLSAKRTSQFKSLGTSVQSTAGSRGVRISGSNAGYTMFRGGVKGTGYPLHSHVSSSLPLPYVTVCHQVSIELYLNLKRPLSGGIWRGGHSFSTSWTRGNIHHYFSHS